MKVKGKTKKEGAGGTFFLEHVLFEAMCLGCVAFSAPAKDKGVLDGKGISGT